jgi:Zn-dependent oligopeptidase
LFGKIEELHNMKEDMLANGTWNAEQVRLAERVYIAFVRMGAKLNEEERKEYADIKGEIKILCDCRHAHPIPTNN